MFTTPLVNSHSANCRVVKRATQITMNHISFSQSCWQPEEEGRTETKEKKRNPCIFTAYLSRISSIYRIPQTAILDSTISSQKCTLLPLPKAFPGFTTCLVGENHLPDYYSSYIVTVLHYSRK